MKVKIRKDEHAILVQGTASKELATKAIKKAGLPEWVHLLPRRPLWFDNKPGVAYYFHWGPFCDDDCEGCARKWAMAQPRSR